MTLYEITKELKDKLDNLDIDENGEILNSEALEDAQLLFDEKVEGCAVWTKNLNAEIEALKTEIKALQTRLKAKERKADWMSGYIDAMLHEVGQNKFETPKCSLSYRKSTSVEVTVGAESLPKEYQNITVEVKPDKTKLKEALKNGKEVEGVTLVEKFNLQIK